MVRRKALWALTSVALLAPVAHAGAATSIGAAPRSAPQVRTVRSTAHSLVTVQRASYGRIVTTYRTVRSTLSPSTPLATFATQPAPPAATPEGTAGTTSTTGTLSTDATGCWGYNALRSGYSWTGIHLYTYGRHMEWCGNYSWITYKYQNLYLDCCAPLWDYAGTVSFSQQYGVGWNVWIVWSQGHFHECMAWCFDDTYPWVYPEVTAWGTVYPQSGG